MKSFVLDKTTGDFAVGTIVVASLALLVHSFVNIHPFLKFYSGTAAWNLFMSLPLLILTYLLGTIVTTIISSLFDWIYGDTMKVRVERMYILGLSNNQYLLNLHDKFAQKIEILQSMFFAFILLCLAVIIKVLLATDYINSHLEHGKLVLFLFALFLFICSGVFLYMAKKLRKEKIEIYEKLAKSAALEKFSDLESNKY